MSKYNPYTTMKNKKKILTTHFIDNGIMLWQYFIFLYKARYLKKFQDCKKAKE